MIECNPQGICSWNYYLHGSGHQISTNMSWYGREGGVVVDGVPYQISKTGVFSPVWTMHRGNDVFFSAQRGSFFSSRYDIGGAAGQAVLEADGLFTRAMRLYGPDCQCTIRPVHPFTRRAVIEGTLGDLRRVAFGFWLTAMMWRQRSQSNANAGSAG